MATVARRARVRNTGRRRMGKYESKYHEMCDFVQRVMLENVAYMNLLRQKEDEAQQALLQCRTLFRKLMQRVDLISEEDGHVLDKVAVTLGGIPPSVALKAAEEAALQAQQAKKAAASKSRHRERSEKKQPKSPTKAKDKSKAKSRAKSATAKATAKPSHPAAVRPASTAVAAASMAGEASPSRDSAIFQAQRGLRRKQVAEKARATFYTQLRELLKEFGVGLDEAGGGSAQPAVQKQPAEAAEGEATGEEGPTIKKGAQQADGGKAAGATGTGSPRDVGAEQEHRHREQGGLAETGKADHTADGDFVHGGMEQQQRERPSVSRLVSDGRLATDAAEALNRSGSVAEKEADADKTKRKKMKKRNKDRGATKANGQDGLKGTEAARGVRAGLLTDKGRRREQRNQVQGQGTTEEAAGTALNAVADQEQEGDEALAPSVRPSAATESKKRKSSAGKGERGSKAAKKGHEDAVGAADGDKPEDSSSAGEKRKKGKKAKTKEHTTRHTISVRRTEDGAVILPIRMTNGNIVALGNVQSGREHFDLEDITYPVGFQADLKLRNKSGNRIKITFRIEEDDERPLFKAIIHTRQGEHLFTHHSLEGLYRTLLRQMNRQESKHTVRRAAKMLGVGEPSVVAILKAPGQVRTVQEEQQPRTPSRAKRRKAPAASATDTPAEDKTEGTGSAPRRRRRKDGQKKAAPRKERGDGDQGSKRRTEPDDPAASQGWRDQGMKQEEDEEEEEEAEEEEGDVEREGPAEEVGVAGRRLGATGYAQPSDDDDGDDGHDHNEDDDGDDDEMTETEPSPRASPRYEESLPEPHQQRYRKQGLSPLSTFPVPQPKPMGATQLEQEDDQTGLRPAPYWGEGEGEGEGEAERRRRRRKHRGEGAGNSSSSSARGGAKRSKAARATARTASASTSGDGGASTESASVPSGVVSPAGDSSSAYTSGGGGGGRLVQQHQYTQPGVAGHTFPGHMLQEHPHRRPSLTEEQEHYRDQEQQAFAPPRQVFSPGGAGVAGGAGGGGGHRGHMPLHPQHQLQLHPPMFPHTPQEAHHAQGGSGQSSIHSPPQHGRPEQQQQYQQQQQQHHPGHTHQQPQLPYSNSAHMSMPVLQGYHHMPSLPPGGIPPMMQSGGMQFPLGAPMSFGMPSFTQASHVPVSTPFYQHHQQHGLHQQQPPQQDASPQQPLHPQQGAFAGSDRHPPQAPFEAPVRGSASRKKSKHKHKHKTKNKAREQ